MHVGWNWIKQRPHFIAEELSNDHEVFVISDYSYRMSKSSNSYNNANLRVSNFYKIPFFDHFECTAKINFYLRRIVYRYHYKHIDPDYIYVMSPNVIEYLPRYRSGVKLIYDCMDDMISFTSSEEKKKKIIDRERRLINKADVVIASSNNLKEKLVNRYGVKKITVVRNAYNGELVCDESDYIGYKSSYNLCYFGTIASWINFDYVIKALNEIDGLEFTFIGPKHSGIDIPSHKRLKYIGAVQHDLLIEKVKNVDAFVMPFVVNELIESVDPVKLYEYINFDKNILCVKYDEVLRFDDFVYFYSTYEEFKEKIIYMMSNRGKKYSHHKRAEFLNSNTWKCRAEMICKYLK